MKRCTLLFFLFIFSAASAQIKVDSGYTVLSNEQGDSSMTVAFLLGDLHSIMIKENATGKLCRPVSMHWTFVIGPDVFQTNSTTEAKNYLPRLKPQDLIFIEKIKLPADCFPPPKQIEITIR